MMTSKTNFVVLTILLMSTTGYSWLYTGRCKVGTSEGYPAICIKSKLSSGKLFGLEEKVFPPAHSNLYGYAGLHLFSIFSIHGSGRIERIEAQHEEDVTAHRQILNHGFLQIGNSLDSRFRLQIGKFLPAFALNHNPNSQIVKYIYEKDLLSTDYNRSVKVTFDNLIDAGLELSASYRKDETKENELSDEVITAGRLHYDTNALGGTRLVLSFRHLGTIQRMYSFGIFNTGVDRSITAIEFIRQTKERGIFASESALTRISYESDVTAEISNIFKFEGLTDDYRTLQLGSQVEIYKALKLSFTLGHYFSGGYQAKYENHNFLALELGGTL